MPYHDWSDDSFDWNALNSAINYCTEVWRRWGRIGSHGKEKYGTFRDHIYIWDGGIWSLFYPGYMRIKPGFWHFVYFYLDRKLVIPATRMLGIQKLGHWYQAQVYNYAVQKVCVKYPHIVDEIVSDLGGYEMVKPGIFGKIDGTAIHKKYWTSM